jgi:hypothetical protein
MPDPVDFWLCFGQNIDEEAYCAEFPLGLRCGLPCLPFFRKMLNVYIQNIIRLSI